MAKEASEVLADSVDKQDSDQEMQEAEEERPAETAVVPAEESSDDDEDEDDEGESFLAKIDQVTGKGEGNGAVAGGGKKKKKRRMIIFKPRSGKDKLGREKKGGRDHRYRSANLNRRFVSEVKFYQRNPESVSQMQPFLRACYYILEELDKKETRITGDAKLALLEAVEGYAVYFLECVNIVAIACGHVKLMPKHYIAVLELMKKVHPDSALLKEPKIKWPTDECKLQREHFEKCRAASEQRERDPPKRAQVEADDEE